MVASALTSSVLRSPGEEEGRAFHITHPQGCIPLQSLFAVLKDVEGLEQVDYVEWCNRLERQPDNPINPLWVGMQWNKLPEFPLWGRKRISNEKMILATSRQGIAWDAVDSEVLRRYVLYFRKVLRGLKSRGT